MSWKVESKLILITLWIALGLALLVHCGVEDTVALLAMDLAQAGEGDGPPWLVALCLTLLVVAWPVVMVEMVRSDLHR